MHHVGLFNHSEKDKRLHQSADLFLVLLIAFRVFLQQLNQIIFFERGAFLDVSLLFDILHGLLP